MLHSVTACSSAVTTLQLGCTDSTYGVNKGTVSTTHFSRIGNGEPFHKSTYKPDTVQSYTCLETNAHLGHLLAATVKLPERNQLLVWTRAIAELIDNGLVDDALNLFKKMLLQGIMPDGVAFVSILNACSSSAALAEGKLIHACIVEKGIQADVPVGNAIIKMYGKCGSLEDVRNAFHSMLCKNVISWTAMIQVYVQNSCHKEAFHLFRGMILEGIMPNKVTFVTIVDVVESPSEAKLLHAWIIDSKVEQDVVLGTALVRMYGKCGSLENAQKIFNTMAQQDVVLWTTMISACIECGKYEQALRCFRQMQLEGMIPNKITMVTVLDACSAPALLSEGRLIHACIAECKFELEVIVATSLLKMYGKCGSLADARYLFNRMPQRNLISWSTLTSAYAEHGHCDEAIELFRRMHLEGMAPNKITFVTVLAACSSPRYTKTGALIHACIAESTELNDVVVTALIDMYCKCGSLQDAEALFQQLHKPDDVICWSAMLSGYTENGRWNEAIQLFRQMQIEGMTMDTIFFVTMLEACAGMKSLEEGKLIHEHISETKSCTDPVVGISLMKMYGECGSIEDTVAVFKGLNNQDVLSWTSMLEIYAQKGYSQEALELLRWMQLEGMKADNVTFAAALNACANIPALGTGVVIHGFIIQSGLEYDEVVITALANMYAKCGNLEAANVQFEKLANRDSVLWSVMVAAYTQYGQVKEVLTLFQELQQEGIKPDSVNFIKIISACSHAGLVREGCTYFVSMVEDHGLPPTAEHYGCVVDLLGRAGWLGDAEEFISKRIPQANPMMWVTLLGACRMFGDTERAKRAAENVIGLDPQISSPYVVLSNMLGRSSAIDYL